MVSKTRAIISPEELETANKVLGYDGDPAPNSRRLPPNPRAGSLAPLDSTKEGKWERAITAQALTDLADIAQKIHTTMDETVLTVARARLKIGRLLLDARELFPGDLEFGQWRKAMIPDLAPRTCNTYMNMAKEFKDAPQLVESMGWSVARELLNAPESVKQQAREKTERGDPPTRQEVAESKKSSSAPTGELPPQPTGTDKPKPPAPEQIIPAKSRQKSLDQRVQEVLDLNTFARIGRVIEDGAFPELDDASKSAIIFGFGPEIGDSRPNLDVWLAVYDHCKSELTDDEALRILDQAYSKMKECWQ